MNLIVGGKVVRSATGPNTAPGGSETLRPFAWDLSELEGQMATLKIVDTRKGGWGHINVDQIVLTDDRGNIPLAPKPPVELSREVTINGDFLQLPLMNRDNANEPGVHKLTIEKDGKVVRFMHLKLPGEGQTPDFRYSADIREFKGSKVTLRMTSRDPEALEKLEISDEEFIDPEAYEGPHRPRVHFTPRLGWMNDVNGSYYQDGLYHLFYQFNPTTTAWSTGFDMHWGHSVSKDLLHWEEWPVALFPDAAGNCFSGTAVMIQDHLAGVNEGAPLPTPALFFSGTDPFAQHFATTRDGGKSWQRFPGNPVLNKIRNSDRDPKVIWHEESKHYIMVLYVGEPHHYYIFRSKDLQNWEQTQILPHWYECPEFFRVKSPTTGEDLWLLYGCHRTPEDDPEPFQSESAYQLGNFDGKTFTPVTKIHHAHRGSNFYASLIFINEPTDRKIMMGWTRGVRSPGEPFNQAASIPLHLQLKAINGMDQLCFEPIEEFSKLREEPLLTLKNLSGEEAADKLSTLKSDQILDIVVRFEAKQPAPIEVSIRSLKFDYDPKSGKLNDGDPIRPEGDLKARFVIDRTLVESFWNGGEAAFCQASLHTDDGPAFAISDQARIAELAVYPLKNIWKK